MSFTKLKFNLYQLLNVDSNASINEINHNYKRIINSILIKNYLILKKKFIMKSL